MLSKTIFSVILNNIMKAKDYEKSAVTIIPARGGSKGLPGKNIKFLGDQPLIGYSIKAARNSRYVKRVVVTTDDKKIAAAARQCGAETPFLRPAELAQDSTSMLPVIRHTLTWLDENDAFRPEFVFMIQPTSPFVQTEQIDRLFELVVAKDADSGITIIEVPRPFHPYHVRHLMPDGFLEFDRSDLHYQHPTRQSDPKRYAFASVYCFKREAFLKENKMEVGKRVGLPIEPWTAHDINNLFDWQIAEVILRDNNGQK